MKAHTAMYNLAPSCPDCGVVPLYRGHDCLGGVSDASKWKDPCPRCGKEEFSVDYQEECFMCPFCPECCKALRNEVSLARYLEGLRPKN